MKNTKNPNSYVGTAGKSGTKQAQVALPKKPVKKGKTPKQQASK